MEGMEAYSVLKSGYTIEIIEKKSRFIATVIPVETELEAVTFINATKKKYWDAAHNCSAFVIGKEAEITRCSDDGEPSGTAGRPILEVLLGKKVRNVAVVVTRYFGGVLLGTGGLVRIYQKATKEALQECEIVEKRLGILFQIQTDYNNISKIQYLLAQAGITEYQSVYDAKVCITVMIPIEWKEKIKKEMNEATSGTIEIEEMGSSYYFNSSTIK